MSNESNHKGRQHYSKPQLQQFGLLRQLTQAGSGKASEAANDPECDTKFDRKVNNQCVGP